jgi:hypothetical protein
MVKPVIMRGRSYRWIEEGDVPIHISEKGSLISQVMIVSRAIQIILGALGISFDFATVVAQLFLTVTQDAIVKNACLWTHILAWKDRLQSSQSYNEVLPRIGLASLVKDISMPGGFGLFELVSLVTPE